MSTMPGCRAVKLVYDRGENPFVWLVDASTDEWIRCCVWAFDSPEEAEPARRATAKSIDLGAPIDEVLTRTGFMRHAAQGSFPHAQAVVEFLANELDPTLRANARNFLEEMRIFADSELK